MLAVLDARPPGGRDTIDLLRGALDAHLHPSAPSRVPGQAALLAGAAWTVVAMAVLVEPAPPDWPGYLAWTLPVALVGVVAGLVASLGLALRLGDGPGRLARFAVSGLVVGLLALAVALAVAIAGGPYGAATGAAATAAAVGTVATGLVLLRTGDPGGVALMVIGGAAVLPPPGAWLVLGAAWTVTGLWLVAERTGSMADRGGTVTDAPTP